MLILVLLILQVFTVLFAVYTGRAKLKKLVENRQNDISTNVDPTTSELSDIDKAILRLLVERQGAVYQSEITRELGLPKSTVHKALRRLSEAGYVEIQRRGRFNLVVLKRVTSEVSVV